MTYSPNPDSNMSGLTKLEKAIFGRDGLIGRRFIGGTDEDRERYERFKSRFHAKAINARKEMARSFQDTPDAFIDRDTGYAVFGPRRFPEVDDVVQAARDLMQRMNPEDITSSSKPHLMTRLLVNRELDLDSPFLRFILRPDILRAASAYLGVVPILKDVDIWYSVNPGHDTFKSSQLYHADWESVRQIKIFLYVSEVTDSNGPLIVMGAKTSEGIRHQLNYRYFQKDNGQDSFGRIPDEQVRELVGERDQHTVMGPPGTVAFVDTGRCLHYGSRVSKSAAPRTLVFYQLLPPMAFTQTFDYRKRSPLRHLAHDDLPELQRLVLGADL